jgi:hypothetical protein
VVTVSRVRWGAAVVAAVVALALAGCGAPDDETVRPVVTTTLPPDVPTDLADLPVGTGHVGPADRVRAHCSTLRVNGRAVDLAPLRVREFAVVNGGVFFRNGTELWFTDLGRARATPYTDVQSLVASPDGRRFAFLDLQHGPKDKFGTPLAISIAYDASTGKALVASYAGMGDITKDDLLDLYEDAEPAVIGFDGDDLLVHGATGGDYRIPLDGSPPTHGG